MLTGWWFGTWLSFFPSYWEFIIIPTDELSIIFQVGVGLQNHGRYTTKQQHFVGRKILTKSSSYRRPCSSSSETSRVPAWPWRWNNSNRYVSWRTEEVEGEGEFSLRIGDFIGISWGFHEDFMFLFDVFVGDLWDRQGIEWYFRDFIGIWWQ
jgi:hypothetical protein